MIGARSSPVVRFLVVWALGAATIGMIVVSMRANFLFGYAFGQTAENGYVFGSANVAADVWKVSGLILIGSLWRTKRRRLAIVLFPMWALCLLWGMIGAIGIYAQDRSALVRGREDTTQSYSDAEREARDIETNLSGLSGRTVEQIDAAIAAVLARPVRVGDRVRGNVSRISANCTRDDRLTVEACLEVARLREERAGAEEAARLRSRMAELHAELRDLRIRGATLPSDPAAELIAWMTRGQLKVRDISFGFPLAFAVLIELISAFGPVAIAAYAESTRCVTVGEKHAAPRQAMASSGVLHLTAASLGEPGRVMRWMAERTEPASGTAAVWLGQLYGDYEEWCAHCGATSLSAIDFQTEFDRLRGMQEMIGAIRKFGNRYYGIRVITQPQRKLLQHG